MGSDNDHLGTLMPFGAPSTPIIPRGRGDMPPLAAGGSGYRGMTKLGSVMWITVPGKEFR